MNHHTPAPLYIALRHGVIVGHGPDRPAAAAAAAAAARVSRCELRMATPDEALFLEEIAGRRLPADTEAQLLEAIYTDIHRLLAAVDDGDDEWRHIREPVLTEYRRIDPDSISDAAHVGLQRRLDVIRDELDELCALARQGDLFADAAA